MKLNYLYVLIFFLTIAAGALLLFPTGFDVVTLYRNSYLYTAALDLLDRLESSDPGDERLSLERARVLYLTGDYERSADLLERLGEREPDNPEVWRQLAHTRRTLQQQQPAMEALEKLLAVAPADSEALYLLSEYYRWFQIPEKAEASLQTLVEQYPGDYDNYDQLIDLYLLTDRSAEAAAVLERAIATFPDSLQLQYRLAQVYLSDADARAPQAFEALHRAHPERQDFFDGLSSALIRAERGDEALERFQAYYRPRLQEAAYYERLGRLYIYLSRPDEAIAAFARKLELDPSADTRVQLVDLYARAGRHAEAAREAGLLVQEDGQRADFWRLYAAHLAASDQRRELVGALEAYAERWPDDPDMALELADAYQWVEDYRSEVRVLEGLLAAEPHRSDLAERLAIAHYALGERGPAARYYARLLAAEPDSSRYRRDLLEILRDMPPGPETLEHAERLYAFEGPAHPPTALFLARLYAHQQKSASAVRVYAGLAAAHPDSAGLLALIGRDLLDQQQPAEADPYLLRALQGDPDNRLALSGLAETSWDKEPLRALAYLQRLETLQPDDPETLYRLGLTCEALGDSAQMVAYYRRLLERVGQSPRTDLYFLRQKAHALYRTGDLSAARLLLEAALERHPSDLDLKNDYAEVLIAQRQYQEALGVLEGVPRPQ